MEYVLFIDSGMGGATIIKSYIQKYGNINFIFHCENAHAPLGNLSKKTLQKLCNKIISNYTSKYNISLIVLACNTLTSACVKILRKNLKINIVGVEPNIKVNGGKTLVIATNYTIKNCEVLQSVPYNKIALPKLSYYIDKYYPKLDKKIKGYLCKHLPIKSSFDNIILGCTHYVLAKKQIQQIYPNANFYDSIMGTINQINRLLNGKTVCGKEAIIVLSKPNKKLLQNVEKYIFDNNLQ